MYIKDDHFHSVNKLTEKKLVMDMIHNFILPEVEKHNKRNICDGQQNYIRDAYISIYEKILNLPPIKSLQVIKQKVHIKNKINISNLFGRN